MMKLVPVFLVLLHSAAGFQLPVAAPTTRGTELSAYRYNPYMYEEPGSNIGRTWDDDYAYRQRRLRPYNGYYNNMWDSEFGMYNGYRSLRPDRKCSLLWTTMVS